MTNRLISLLFCCFIAWWAPPGCAVDDPAGAQPSHTLDPPSIAGFVRDRVDQHPLVGAAVQVLRAGAPVATATTDSTGAFQVFALAPGACEVQATQPGYVASGVGVTVSAGSVASADILLAAETPQLSVEPLALDFGARSTALSFTVQNLGVAGEKGL